MPRLRASGRRALGVTVLMLSLAVRGLVAFTSAWASASATPRQAPLLWRHRAASQPALGGKVQRAVFGGEAELGASLAATVAGAPLTPFDSSVYDWFGPQLISSYFGQVDAGILVIQFFSVLFASCFGFGDAVLSIPLLAVFMHVEPSQAAPMVTAVGIVLTTLTIVVDVADGSMAKSGRWADSFLLAAAAAVGVPIGVQALLLVDPRIIRAIVGVLLIMYGAFSAFGKSAKTGQRSSSSSSTSSRTLVAPEGDGDGADLAVAAAMASSREKARAPTAPTLAALPVGFLAGFLGGAVAEFGPPVVVYGSWQRWSPTTMRTMLARFFLPLTIYALCNFAAVGLWTNAMLVQVVATIPAVIVALALGTAFNRRVDPKAYSKVLYCSIVCLGLLCMYSVL